MSDAAAAPVAAVLPDPHRAVPEHIGQVLGLVRILITYGRNLAETLRRHAADPYALPCFAFVTSVFGTGDLALILARITRGLLRAAALEARLSQRAARGRDLRPAPIRLPSLSQPGAPKPANPPGSPAGDPCLARLPTPQEIAAEVRCRPIGAVLVDICLDLGIMPGQMDRATWDELFGAIIEYGGSLVTLLLRRQGKRRAGDPAGNAGPGGGFRFLPIPTTGQPITALPAWPVPSPRPPPLMASGVSRGCTGPP
ncbi:MAG TPA: hypothetical protein VFW75_16235 [Acetobacteraceae bacterium]|nr:hypothetical protein [Acetobacteraceae bacterium]